jgi:hypothetical protein
VTESTPVLSESKGGGAVSMLNYDVLSKKFLIFRSFTDLEVPELNALNSKLKEPQPKNPPKTQTHNNA